MIQIENLSKVFRTSEVETIALNHVNIEVKEGEFVAIDLYSDLILFTGFSLAMRHVLEMTQLTINIKTTIATHT